ncbi:TDP-N-acetylfucosamine:lipid II N-acetylfucosaminyltransferase [Limnobacter sp. 130]|uniref:TDP-N-acetylfucosamine:lipid II N-acetylfucosaminyltransferase n=1 Tax=Limnobacter sp. 130 TaxID=2653147 RepID=UPI001F3B8C95|nr:TDP-N-acetylfucosamine:lipid II N-acetylfucosaminyltransferase [Limnobacter sp. 130]
MHAEKFTNPFLEFMNENFSIDNHLFLIFENKKHEIKSKNTVLLRENLSQVKKLLIAVKYMNKAEKIIVHGLIGHNIYIYLLLQPWLLKRVYWTIWGGDLYSHTRKKTNVKSRIIELARLFVIKRLGHLVTHIRGDYELAQEWYGAKGVWHECFMYPSNLHQESPIQDTPHDGRNILLGNSADPSNNHIDALEKLRPYATENIQIFCPLSYGDAEHAKKVADYGKNIFGDKFIPLLEFIRFDEYKQLLAKIDIAIFNHKRQQGMGNITTLLGMGKKVFMRSDVTSYNAIRSLGALVYDIERLDLLPLEVNHARSNSKIIENYFSSKNLLQSWREIYKG